MMNCMLRDRAKRLSALVFYAITAFTLLTAPAMAQNADSFIVVDAGSGRILNSRNPDIRLYPASMTKIMTLYLTFEALSQGRLSLSTPLSVSELAAEQAPSKLGLRPGSSISTENCILAAVTLSANDCAMVLAENISGSEDEFARLMTSRAHSLGMSNTHFDNPNGLPDDGQLTTARDMATLAEALIQRFPKYYRYFATRSFTYNGIAHANHNHLMSRYPGMDGIKTGFIRASGFNLTASAVRGGHRLIAVVFGGSSAVSRDNYMAGLLNDGFARVAGQPATAQPGEELIAAPPEKPEEGASQNTIAQLVDRTGKVDGVDLAEAGDDVENGEGGPAARNAIVAAPLQTEPAASPVKQEAAAVAATAAVVGAGVMAALPPAKPAIVAEGDADIAEPPPHVLRLPVHKAAFHPPQPQPKQSWGVQIGTFSSRVVSDAMLQHAVSTLPSDIRSQAHPVSQTMRGRHGRIFRAELTGFDQLSAKRACAVLTHCVPIKN